MEYLKNDKEVLDSLAEDALNQIEEKKYDTELKALGFTNIIKMAIAFPGKETAIRI